MQRIRELWQNLSARSKRALIVIAALTTVAIAIGVFFLVRGAEKRYKTLFTGLSQDEAQQVVGLLQEENVDFLYDGNAGTVRVPDTMVDSMRARLLSAGYPKSGFTYDMYISNSGLMTTESDKQQYTLYDLQDRLGATIRLFEGVRDAKVTIAQGSEQLYAISDGNSVEATASVVVTMEDGMTLSEANASAIQNLIARSVKGMTFTNVSVFDAATMTEVGGDGGGGSAGGKSMTDLTAQVEANIASNVRRVVGKIYGPENVAVSVKGTLNMARLISEVTQYSVPEKIDEEDKRGLIEHEEYTGEYAGDLAENAAGVVGADANADTPRYTYQDGTGVAADGYSNSSAERDWLYNVLREQREISPGVLEDLSVAVAVNTSDTSIAEANLINLVADAAGIPREDARNKITILRALKVEEPEPQREPTPDTDVVIRPTIPLWAIIGAIAAGVLMLLTIIFVIVSGRRKKKRIALELAAQEEAERERAEQEALAAAQQAEEEKRQEEEQDEDAMAANDAMAHGMRLKKNIGEFAEQNPQVVARLIQSWLREGEEQIGRKQYRTTRK